MNDWLAAVLSSGPSRSGPGPFCAVARLLVSAAGPQVGTGFLIHPAVLLTAAHVATYAYEGKFYVAGRIQADFGNILMDVWKIAIPRAFMESQGFAPAHDLALLRLPEPVHEMDTVLTLEAPAPGSPPANAKLWGKPYGGLQGVSVTAGEKNGALAYPLGQSMDGFSGGPVTRELAAPQGAAALGLHRDWVASQRLGEALIPDLDSIRRGFQALREI